MEHLSRTLRQAIAYGSAKKLYFANFSRDWLPKPSLFVSEGAEKTESACHNRRQSYGRTLSKEAIEEIAPIRAVLERNPLFERHDYEKVH